MTVLAILYETTEDVVDGVGVVRNRREGCSILVMLLVEQPV